MINKVKICKTCKQTLSISCFDQWNTRKVYKKQCRECVNRWYVDQRKKKESITKTCVLCKIEKNKSDFDLIVKGDVKVQSKCKKCFSELKKKKYWENRDKELHKLEISRNRPENILKRKEYYEKNKEDYKERYLRYMQDNEKRERRLAYSRELHAKNKDKINARKKEYHKSPEFKSRSKEKHKNRKQVDVIYNIKRRLRFRLRHIIIKLGSNNFKSKSAIDLLGCDMVFFKNYIEGLFTDGMSWNRLSEIHLDHIKPCARFDLTKIEEQKKCFHYTNIQPLWAKDNLIKKDKYELKNM